MRPELLIMAALLFACDDGGGTAEPGPTTDAAVGDASGAGGAGGGVDPDAGAGGAGGQPADAGSADGAFASTKNNLRFKRVDRLNNDFARALGLDPGDVCRELGLYPCDDVHRVPLGGVDPYERGLYEPQEGTAVTAPMVVDRMALAACEKRLDTDILRPNEGVIFHGVPYDGAGALTVPVDSPEVRLALSRLYTRALLREITDAEVAHYAQFYEDIVATGAEAPARAWGILVCYATLTSVEAVFY